MGAVAFEELVLGGAKTIIRLGTRGLSRWDEIGSGDLLIATGAIREDGVSQQLFPARRTRRSATSPSRGRSIDAADAHPVVRFGTGVLMTKAAFYPGALNDERAVWSQTPLVGYEMELAALLIVAALGASGPAASSPSTATRPRATPRTPGSTTPIATWFARARNG